MLKSALRRYKCLNLNIKISKLLEDGEQSILSARRFYETKYYGMFINALNFPELDQEQQHYLLKQLWSTGSVACFVDKSSIPDKSLKNLSRQPKR